MGGQAGDQVLHHRLRLEPLQLDRRAADALEQRHALLAHVRRGGLAREEGRADQVGTQPQGIGAQLEQRAQRGDLGVHQAVDGRGGLQ